MSSQSGRVQMQGVQKRYGEVLAVKELNLTIEAGELVTLLGPSGCGKTTTLRMLAGLEDVSAGHITIGGQDVTTQAATYRNVAMVFQSYALFPHMTVMENVAYGLTVSKLPKRMVHEKAEAGLETVGLAGYGARYPSELSGGQQQRVAVARAVVLEPDVLLFDEPLSNLDAKLRRHVREEIRQIQQDLGITALYVTHDQEEAMAVSDKIVVMRDGEIAQMGAPRELYTRPASAFIADFIGDANLLPCRVAGVEGESVAVDIGAVRLRARSDSVLGETATLAVHPHNLELVHLGNANVIPGTVRMAAYLGDHMEYAVESDAGELFVADHRMTHQHRRGDRVGVRVEVENATVLPG